MQCTWTGFFDAESPIVKFVLTVGTSAGSSDILSPVELPNTESSYTSEGDKLINIVLAMFEDMHSIEKIISLVLH